MPADMLPLENRMGCILHYEGTYILLSEISAVVQVTKGSYIHLKGGSVIFVELPSKELAEQVFAI